MQGDKFVRVHNIIHTIVIIPIIDDNNDENIVNSNTSSLLSQTI